MTIFDDFLDKLERDLDVSKSQNRKKSGIPVCQSCESNMEYDRYEISGYTRINKWRCPKCNKTHNEKIEL